MKELVFCGKCAWFSPGYQMPVFKKEQCTDPTNTQTIITHVKSYQDQILSPKERNHNNNCSGFKIIERNDHA